MSTPTQTQGPQTATKPAQPNAAAPAAAPQGATKPADTKPADTKPAKPEVTIDDINGGFMLTADFATQSAPVRARNERQQAMDKRVKELHALWVKANKPSNWDAMVKAGVVATYFSEPDKSAGFHQLINRAVAFHSLRARMGTSFKVTEKLIAQHGLPKEYLGREVISFAVLDKRPRATSDGKPASEVIKK